MNNNKNIVSISQFTAKRIVKDIKNIKKEEDELKKNGIFYKHDEDNLLKGYAMIIGPENTPYQNGFYFFTFKFSEEYPFVPPIVIFKTYDGFTRFNPNLYINGKVCLSILNTWKGEQWSSCQNIRSILLYLVSILNENPLLNEPGVKKEHPDVEKYNKIIKFQNYNLTIYNQLINEKISQEFKIFLPEMNIFFKDNKNKIINDLSELSKNNNIEIIDTIIYKLKCKIDYMDLLDKFNKINIKFNKN
jgi:ubiquitin-conjugating enzyme E2 Z